jgi:hypothetical protein
MVHPRRFSSAVTLSGNSLNAEGGRRMNRFWASS